MNVIAAVVVIAVVMAGQVAKSVPATDAAKYTGTKQTVCGALAGVRREKAGGNGDLLLDLERPHPNSALTVVVTKETASQFVAGFETRTPALTICATGKIESKTVPMVRVGKTKDIRGFVPAAPGKPRSDQSVDTLPRVIRDAKPSYTSAAMRAGIQGSIEIEARVGVDGSTSDHRVVRSLDALYGLDEAAIQAVSEWRFEPARRQGQPVPYLVVVTLEFWLS